jgi:hypothetical protein
VNGHNSDLACHLRVSDTRKKIVLLFELSEIGKIAARLSHHPHGRTFYVFAVKGTEQKIVL